MKTFMILGASLLQVPLIRQAKKMGYAPIVVSPRKNDPGFRYASHAVYADVRDDKTILSHACRHKIAGIATDQTDLPVTTAAYVAEKMELPGIGHETARLFTNKYLMREKCRALGLKTPAYRIAQTLAEALSFLDAVDAEVIVKPVDNQGSRGISRASSRKEMEEKFNNAVFWSKSKSVLIEQYIQGCEFVVEGMVCEFKIFNLACGDTYYFSMPDTFTPWSRIFPSTANDETTTRILAADREIITGFGLKNGITHSEYIMDAQGDIYLLETAARGGGVFISSDIIPVLTGINTEEFLIRTATGTLAAPPEIKKTGLSCGYIACVLPAGEIVCVKGVEEIQALHYIRGNNLDAIRPGVKTKAFTDKTNRFFTIVFADDHEQLFARIDQIKTMLHVEVNTKTGVKGPIWA